MPTIYLSPSTQEFNPYNGGGNEEYYMNLIADAMEEMLGFMVSIDIHKVFLI